jgi:hypothetical protein
MSGTYHINAQLESLAADKREWLIERNRKFVDMQIENGTNGLTPFLFVMGTDEKLTVSALAVPFNTDLEKRVAMMDCGRRCYRDREIPVLVSLACEAWQSEQVVGERRKYLIPEDDPARKEIAIVFTASIVSPQRVAVSTREIVRRGVSGNLCAIGEWSEDDSGTATSPLLMHFFRGFFSHVNST